MSTYVLLYCTSTRHGAVSTEHSSAELRVIRTNFHRVNSYLLHLTLLFYLVQMTLSSDALCSFDFPLAHTYANALRFYYRHGIKLSIVRYLLRRMILTVSLTMSFNRLQSLTLPPPQVSPLFSRFFEYLPSENVFFYNFSTVPGISWI